MKIEQITTIDELVKLEDKWDDLVENSGNSVFSLYPFIRRWYEVHSDKADLHIITLREDNELVGLAPLVRDEGILRFAGTALSTDPNSEYFDYADFITCEDLDQETKMQFINEALKNEIFDLRELPYDFDTRNLDHLARASPLNGLVQIQFSKTFSSKLPRTFGEYLAGMKKSIRDSVEYGKRRLEREEGPIKYSVATSNNIEANLDNFIRLHKAKWNEKEEDGCFPENESGERSILFCRNLANDLVTKGKLYMASLSVHGEPIAIQNNFIHNGTLSVYTTGLDPNYAKHSPGKLLHFMVVEDIISRGVHTIDFLRGDHEYKRRYGATEKPNWRVHNLPLETQKE